MKDFKDIVKQAYPDIQNEKEHQEKALRCVHFLGMNNTGLNRCFQLNKDIDNYSITMKDCITMDVAFRKMIKENPDKNYLLLSITAGHGMCKDGG